MGLFGFACERCWDYNCDCTPKELEEYRSKTKKIKPIVIEWSKSKPFVTYGDVIIKNGVQFFVEAIDNGLPLCNKITNIPEDIERGIIIKPPYDLLISCAE
jgi:hypothetical protein